MTRDTRQCPGCDNEVIVPSHLENTAVGCNNTEEHDDGEALVMWPQ